MHWRQSAKVGDLIRIPEWQKKRNFWRGWDARLDCSGIVLDITPYAIHVLWSNGEEFAHKAKSAKHFEIIK